MVIENMDWRSPHFATLFDRYDRADFAQEFLRRNHDYRQNYHEVAAPPSERDAQAPLIELADQWGLLSRLQP